MNSNEKDVKDDSDKEWWDELDDEDSESSSLSHGEKFRKHRSSPDLLDNEQQMKKAKTTHHHSHHKGKKDHKHKRAHHHASRSSLDSRDNDSRDRKLHKKKHRKEHSQSPELNEKRLLDEEKAIDEASRLEIQTAKLKDNERGGLFEPDKENRSTIKLTEEQEKAIAERGSLYSQHLLRKHFEQMMLEEEKKRKINAKIQTKSTGDSSKSKKGSHFGAKFSSFEYVPFDRERDVVNATVKGGADFAGKGWAALGIGGGYDGDIYERFSKGALPGED
ncbi:uncharacterized protein MONOS_4173 [Monocercomonoides exilis]|uniref:uncharacterized protein n=1 Tax=Monocercomonoides exilis TaxID=2049356 RepID=UPI00355985B7|nr:hypothetical protein MONOS_4173 [Monocercomonoides exilis]|eukprot:MONOS_4173.1-p1 / transcript=MONOS_4173.1 / gene=MONOS_4173 / organism=Monocercomonoides_exilis_PA203 / gene_product=unspecified product / transcript_product=unspecified product / location=Mono_scaffold00107:45712-46622(-) / protein_length=276 / sequence_SO=supercontig / SO=protein_coding / is_pseudo=false